jgi:RNA polymerase sigma factor (sigma-70 family)
MSPGLSARKPVPVAPNEEVPENSGQNWLALVESIQRGERGGMEELYRVFSRGVRFYLCRQLGPQDLDDKVHDTFVIVVQAIRKGELREPERLMGFVRTVLIRQLGLAISGLIRTRERSIQLDSARHLTAVDSSPEEHALSLQKVALMKQALKQLNDREYEMLTRFYLREQSPEQIQDEMRLTATQFNLLKSRAKAKLTDLVRHKLTRNHFNRE